jgi:hypothetical protein
LVNDNNIVLGTAEKRLIIGVGFNASSSPTNHGMVLNENKIIRRLSSRSSGNVLFANVKADDITDNLLVRIDSVNGIDAETAGRTGFIKITPTNERIKTQRNFLITHGYKGTINNSAN